MIRNSKNISQNEDIIEPGAIRNEEENTKSWSCRVCNSAYERLERSAGKLASCVLRRVAASNGCCLSGVLMPQEI